MKHKKLLRVLAGESVSPPPIWLMRQAGRYLSEYRAVRAKAGSFLNLCYNPELAIEVTLQPIRRFGFDAAILFSDILVVPHALGVPLDYREGEGPVLQPVRSAEAVAKLSREAIEERLAPVYATVQGLAKSLPPETTLIGFAGVPWTVAAYIVEGQGGTDHATLIRWAWRDPQGFAALIGLLVEATTRHLLAQIQAGAEVVQLFESWGGAAPDALFQRWCIEPVTEIVRRLKAAAPEVPVIGFPRGAGAWLARYAEETGVQGIGVDQGTSLAVARAVVPDRVAIQGNLDPLVLVEGGAALDSEIDRITDLMAGAPHVFNLGHGIHQDTPPEHVAQLIERVRSRRP
ncbi:MAG: uroporphyrinogen decarboxylase [Alphaproteobacteria bacterium]|nr:uroporphyrinogen decarboxylase [Alphaproteobacteria bacterium]